MIEITLLAILASLMPIAFALVGTIIFILYPDKHISVIIFAIGLTSLVGLFDLLTDYTLLNGATFQDLVGNMFQAAAAILGILGAFWVYYIDIVKNRISNVRKEAISMVPNMPFDKMYSSDDEFIGYLESRHAITKSTTLPHSSKNLRSLVKELDNVTLITSNLISLFLISMIFGLMSLLLSDSLDFNSKMIKLLAYFILSFQLTSFISGIYGVYRIIYPTKALNKHS